MKPTKIETQLNRIEEIIKVQNVEPLDFTKASKYLNVSKSYLYKLTSKNLIPYYKPSGKKIFFEKSELNKWILKGRIATITEIELEAEKILSKEPNN